MGRSTFVIKQRAFLKLYMIHEAEKGRLYGLQILENLQDYFKDLGYRPTKSEVYKSLHELLKDGYLTREPIIKEGTEMQTLYIYRIGDKEKVKAYKDTIKADLDRSIALLKRALKDNYSQKRG
ncbi:helix-turn-helix transcriptional regulator [Ureibacillus sp. FSL K6-8385]|uniref:Replication termination protein n=1 Tax=Ureibacillus terrenus TaxID=118246 RepID=A0A540V5X8_9BACL|nr:helix-turn-helix transcriptional regulator [Ureibacillus terrenus]MED3660858.1 helix-turn-helix transcriptional regulator [Ureibacillus terrenus]MED3764643.1 helix-turn-helix transcriptional regulator [Ureibacillus terrenus]TQE92159.1 Replication termination protein [Ureibacillus terrenus]